MGYGMGYGMMVSSSRLGAIQYIANEVYGMAWMMR